MATSIPKVGFLRISVQDHTGKVESIVVHETLLDNEFMQNPQSTILLKLWTCAMESDKKAETRG